MGIKADCLECGNCFLVVIMAHLRFVAHLIHQLPSEVSIPRKFSITQKVPLFNLNCNVCFVSVTDLPGPTAVRPLRSTLGGQRRPHSDEGCISCEHLPRKHIRVTALQAAFRRSDIAAVLSPCVHSAPMAALVWPVTSALHFCAPGRWCHLLLLYLQV